MNISGKCKPIKLQENFIKPQTTRLTLVSWMSFGRIPFCQDACPFAEFIAQNSKFSLGIRMFFSCLFLNRALDTSLHAQGQLCAVGSVVNRVSEQVTFIAFIALQCLLIARWKSWTDQYRPFKLKTLVFLAFEHFRTALSLFMKRWSNMIQFSGDFLFSHRNESQPQK